MLAVLSFCEVRKGLLFGALFSLRSLLFRPSLKDREGCPPQASG